MEDAELAAIFVDAAGSASPAGIGAATLGAALRERIAAGQRDWPALALEEAAFVRYLARLSSQGLPAPKFAGDLWLVCACLTGVPGAVPAFVKEHENVVARAAARVSRGAADEAKQAVMVSLLVADPGSEPRLAQYAGRAALRTWLTTVATNTALNHAARKDNQAHESVSEVEAPAAMLGPELQLAKARHGAHLDAALREATGALDPRQRVLLRLHHVQGFTMDRLATMYRVSRSAAGRMVIEAREALLRDTKRRLAARLALSTGELESLIAVLQSDLQVSLARMLDEGV